MESFVPVTIMNNEDTYIVSMITTFNAAVTETASDPWQTSSEEKKKKTWVTVEILDLRQKERTEKETI